MIPTISSWAEKVKTSQCVPTILLKDESNFVFVFKEAPEIFFVDLFEVIEETKNFERKKVRISIIFRVAFRRFFYIFFLQFDPHFDWNIPNIKMKSTPFFDNQDFILWKSNIERGDISSWYQLMLSKAHRYAFSLLYCGSYGLKIEENWHFWEGFDHKVL